MRLLWIIALGSLAGCTLLLNTDIPTCDGFDGSPKVECTFGTCNTGTHQCEGGSGTTGGRQVLITGQIDHVTSQPSAPSPVDLASVQVRGVAALDTGSPVAWSDQVATQTQAGGMVVTGVPEGRYALEFTFAGTPDGIPGGYYLVETASPTIDLGYGTLGRGGPAVNQTVQYVINNGTPNSSSQDVQLLDPDAPANIDLGSEILTGMADGSKTVTNQSAVQAGDRAVVGAVISQTSASGLPYNTYSATGDAGISSGGQVDGVLQLAGFSTNLGSLGVEPFIANVSQASGLSYLGGQSDWAQYSIPGFEQALNPAALNNPTSLADCSGEADLVDGGLDWRDVGCPLLFGAQPNVVSTQKVTFALRDGGGTAVVRVQVKPLPDPLVIPIDEVPLNVQVNGSPIELAGEYSLALGSGDLTLSWTPVSNATRYFIFASDASFYLYVDGQPSGTTASVIIPAAVLQEVFASKTYEELVIESIVDSNPTEVIGKPFRAESPLALELNTLVRLNITH